MAKKKQKQLVQGIDFHGWAWKPYKKYAKDFKGEFFLYAESSKPSYTAAGTSSRKGQWEGRWVRVKFVEVE